LASKKGALTFGGRTADHEVDPQFLERWSPRAFTGEAIPEPTLMSMFEAARWAPSAFNGQPWRFVYARREKPADWGPLFGALIEYNQLWVGTGASVLAYIASDKLRRREGQEPQPHPTHAFDAGAAWGYLALQAHRLGWAAHGMAGFDHARAHAATGLPDADFHINAAIAIGRPADPDVLPEPYRSREVPSGRMPVSGFAFEGRFRP
jgi:nitroreductase